MINLVYWNSQETRKSDVYRKKSYDIHSTYLNPILHGGGSKIAHQVSFYPAPGKRLQIGPQLFDTFPEIYLSTLSQNFDPGGPPGHRAHGRSLKGLKVGKIAHLVKFLDFA